MARNLGTMFAVVLLLLAVARAENIYKDHRYAIITVSKHNWDSQVSAKRNIGHVVIAHFYKASDGKSKTFRDTFNEEAKKNAGIFQFVGIDCENDQQMCSKEEINVFPSIRVYPPVPIPLPPADTEMNLNRMIRVASGYVQSKVHEVTDDNHVQKVGENPAVPKVLLFTDKPGIPLLYKALSLSFDKKLMLGIVRSESKDVFHKYSIRKTPKIIVIKTGEKRPIEYNGETNYSAIFDFLNIYSEQYVVGGGGSLDSAGDKPWLTESIPELNSKSSKDICLETNGALCVIIFSNQKPSKTALDTVKEVRRRYDNKIDRGLKYNFMWIDSPKNPLWSKYFGVQSLPSVVFFHPGKRKRFFKLSGDLEFDSLNAQLEKINGGDAKFDPLGEGVPSFD